MDEVRREPIEIEADQHDAGWLAGFVAEGEREVQAAPLGFDPDDLIADGKGVGGHCALEVGPIRV